MHLMPIIGLLLAIIGILILDIPTLWPQVNRAARVKEKIKKKWIADFSQREEPRLSREYRDYVAKGYPNTREQDRSLMSEKYFIEQAAIVAFFNRRTVNEPSQRLTDKKVQVIGTIISVIGLLLTTIFPF